MPRSKTTEPASNEGAATLAAPSAFPDFRPAYEGTRVPCTRKQFAAYLATLTAQARVEAQHLANSGDIHIEDR